MDKRKNEYVELARLIEAEFHARQDAGILANLNKKNVEGLHVTRDKILKDMREQLKDYQKKRKILLLTLLKRSFGVMESLMT